MATQRKGGGSNLAPIITLVFFVLTTIILGLTTYFGYSELDAKEKVKKEAETKLAAMTKERGYHRTLNYLWRIYMGKPSAKADAAEMARLRLGVEAGNLPDGAGMDDFADATVLAKSLSQAMKWDEKAQLPDLDYEKRLTAKDTVITNLTAQVANANKQAEDANMRAAAARKDADDRNTLFDKQIADLKKKADDDRVADRAELVRVQGLLTKANEEKNAASTAAADANALAAKATKEKGKLADDLADIRREKVKILADREEISKELALLKEKSGRDPAEIEARMLDDDALATLRTWDVKRRDWRVTALDKSGNQPYINLGSADNLRPQMTFSIHRLGPDGRLVGTPKGTLEVVRIVGPHLSQCRITSTAGKGDRERDPIVRGDYLFNPQWDPSQKRRVVLAGLADMNETQADSTREFRDMLKRQNVDLGGYIDPSDEKGLPKLVGDGVNKKTDYVILGDSLDDVKHPRARDEEFRKEFVRIVNSQKEKGRNEAIPVITLRRYLQMIGYVPPRVEKSR